MSTDSDLDELGLSSNDEEDTLSITFNNAADHLKSLVSNLDNATLLTLYGYYKQGSEGKCNTPKPSWYDLRAKSKWEAWNSLGDMPTDEAKKLYIKKIKELDPTFEDTTVVKSKETWVRVSTLQKTFEDDTEKNVTDHIKEGNIDQIRAHLETLSIEHISKLDEEGLSLLHWSADSGNATVLELLLSTGVDVNLKDNDGQTALHYASSCGHVDCIKVLLKNNADVKVVDNDGCCPVSVAFDDNVKGLILNR
ncbi:acyl-CoA-binding domain-containing protein 6 [Aethina tumida]|uniref:acyl-CoA-binding domain-containing protein 6 n=1 Tax=Aethina tumida TaxID=116153 RepID=UPI00096B1690|nr:acyl-CoA-binding domain-containing protein 6 [Aethina tumida]